MTPFAKHHTRRSRLLVSTRRAPQEEGDFATMLARLQADWLVLTGAPRVEPIAEAGHYLQTDQPAAVAAVINDMADAAAAATR